jgi:glycosyltransferase involved in cell wall biosynthesis
MRVGFFIGNISMDNGGIAPYANRVLETLLKCEDSFSHELLVIKDEAKRRENSQLHNKASVLRRIRRRLKDSFQVLLRPGSIEQRLGKTPSVGDERFVGLDLLHVPFQTPPTYELPYVCTMHDVQELHYPAYFSSRERERRAFHYRRALENAAHIVVSFEHVKEDLIRFFACDCEKISVIPVPYSECILKPPAPSKLQEIASRYSKYPRYFLYPAQTWPHKNHTRLIDAFNLARRKLEAPIALICTGRKNENFNSIKSHILDTGSQEFVLFTGVVEDEELRFLYDNCVGVVVPTLYEAGSFPLIEAMALAVPVVCARTTSLPETIGDQEFVFDPYSEKEIADIMVRLCTDDAFRKRNIANSTCRTLIFSRLNVAKQYFDLWSRLLEKK